MVVLLFEDVRQIQIALGGLAEPEHPIQIAVTLGDSSGFEKREGVLPEALGDGGAVFC